jgi:hypothetical protein
VAIGSSFNAVWRKSRAQEELAIVRTRQGVILGFAQKGRSLPKNAVLVR